MILEERLSSLLSYHPVGEKLDHDAIRVFLQLHRSDLAHLIFCGHLEKSVVDLIDFIYEAAQSDVETCLLCLWNFIKL